MNIAFRRAALSDLAILVDLGRSTFYDTYLDHFKKDFDLKAMDAYLKVTFSEGAQLKEMEDPSSTFFLAELDREVIGYCKTSDLRPSVNSPAGKGFAIARIYIDKQFHNRGLGSRFLKYLENFAIDEGFEYAWLGVWDGNHAAIRFYERLGYQQFGEEPFYITGSSFQDIDLLMWKDLSGRGDTR